MKDSTAKEDLVEEKEELMVLPSENSRLSSKKTHLLEPCLTSIDGSEAVLPRQSRLHFNALSLSVSFPGWRDASTRFKSWAKKMAALHKPIWAKAGIYEAVMSSTYKIKKNRDLVLGIAEKWCPDTRTFVFPWGETTITLKDVMVILGFSVLGLPVFATLDASGKKIMAKMEKEWSKFRKEKITFVTQPIWMRRFMDRNDELEHVAFLVCWLCYFVFPSRHYHVYEAVLPIAVHLSIGTKIALAPAFLAHLYAELRLLKNHIKSFGESPITVTPELASLFKLVQVWTWERIKELQPVPNPLLEGQPRLALWHEKQREIDVRRILDNLKIDSFEWRPYTKSVKRWEFPQFYPEKTIFVPVGPNLDDGFASFARCIKVSELVGIDYVEHYFPDRVASQFGMLQDVPCLVNRSNLSQEEAWDHYNKPIDDLTLYIPSRYALPCVTPTFCEWWTKTFQEFQSSSEKRRVVKSADTCFFLSASKMNRRNEHGRILSKDLKNKRLKYMMRARYKRRKYTKQARKNDESTMVCFQTQVPSDNDKEDDRLTIAQMVRHNKKKYSDVKNSGEAVSEPLGKKSRLEAENKDSGPCQKLALISVDGDDSLSIAQMVRQHKKKYSDVTHSEGDASEPVGKKSRLEADNEDSEPCQKLALIRADGDEAVPPPEIEQRNEETDETGRKAGKNIVLSLIDETNSSDPPLGANGVDNVVSPPETMQTCDDELDVCGSDADMIDDSSEEPNFLVQEDGFIAGDKAEKLCSEAEKEDDVVDNDRLVQEKLALEEEDLALKADNNEPIPPQKLASGDSYEKSLHELEVLASSIEERINKAERNLAWLQEKRAIKQRKIAATRLI